MTRKQDIETVWKACIKANPRIKRRMAACTECKREVVLGGTRIVRERDIEIADVLIALDANSNECQFNLSSNMFRLEKGSVAILWNLSKTLEGQSDETLSALAGLLG